MDNGVNVVACAMSLDVMGLKEGAHWGVKIGELGIT